MADLKAVAAHQYLFPFYINEQKTAFNLAEWEASHSSWKKQFLKPSSENYAVRQYFNNEVSRLLWDRYPRKADNLSLNHYVYATFGGSYEIKVHRDEDDKRLDYDYNLKVLKDGLQLYLLDGLAIGILCLSVQSTNNDCTLEDVLRINQWGRRIYWPFINLEQDNPVCFECADELALILSLPGGKEQLWRENFSANSGKGEDFMPRYAVFIRELLDGINFQHIIDDRMFTRCFCKSEAASNLAQAWSRYQMDADILPDVETIEEEPSKKPLDGDYLKRKADREAIDLWYRLCYVDISLTCHNSNMKAGLLKNVTYDRWSECGTFFAFTRYSFIQLVDWDSPGFLHQHFQQHYHYMTVILLLQRANLISFSDQVNFLADKHIICQNGECNKVKPQKDEKVMLDELANFRKKYILFINKVWFEEISPQEQGIELYA